MSLVSNIYEQKQFLCSLADVVSLHISKRYSHISSYRNIAKIVTLCICVLLISLPCTTYAEQYFIQGESSSGRRRFYFFLTTDGIVPATAEAGGQPTISINGGVATNTSDTLRHIDTGGYYIILTQTEIGTLGKVLIRYASGNTVEFKDLGSIESPSVSSDISSLKSMLHRLILTVNWLKWKLEQSEQKITRQAEVTQE